MENSPIFDEVVVMFGNYEHFYMLMNNSSLIILIASLRAVFFNSSL